MRLLSSTDIGLKVLLFMAASARELVQQAEISQCFNIKTTAMKRPFRALCDGGIIVSRIGRSGGYSLKRDPKTVTLEEVIKLLETDFHLIPLMEPDKTGKSRYPNSTYLFALERAKSAFLHQLGKFTVAELAGDPYTLEALGIPRSVIVKSRD